MADPKIIEEKLGRFEKEIQAFSHEIQGLIQEHPDLPTQKVRERLIGLLDSYQPLRRETLDFELYRQEMATLIEVSNLINSVLEMDKLLNLIMDMAIRVMVAERGFLMLKDKDTGELAVRVARNMEEEMKDQSQFTISSSISSRVAREGEPILTTDAQEDARFQGQASIMDYSLRSLICVPLKIKSDVTGVIYLDNRTVGGAFSDRSIKFLTSFANQAAIAIENARLVEKIQQETRMRSNLQRYLSPNLVDDIMNKKKDLALGGERVECSILFADICGFTALSEKMSSEEVVRMLNEYFTRMADIIFKHGGTLDKFMGDGILVLFGTPVFSDQSALEAVDCAFGMQQESEKLAREWAQKGWPTFKMRIGINTGAVVAGNIGSPQRMDYTVIGDGVNLASRVEAKAPPGGVLITRPTLERVKNAIRYQTLDPVRLKGKTEPVEIFLVTDLLVETVKEFRELRREKRKEASLFATYRHEKETKVNQGIIQNISPGGVFLSTKVGLPEGSRLELSFNLTDEMKCDGIWGTICQAQQSQDDQGRPFYKLGIKFEPLSPSDNEKVLSFVSQT
ncbi:GAF domain-containing protein [candidate division KSB1 bacterium]|nr:GAF domain-containing protein [candidate division KSB1 bacterium]